MLILTNDDAKVQHFFEYTNILVEKFLNLYTVEITDDIIIADFFR